MKAMNTPLKITLLGVGKMGQNHLRVLSMLKGVELAYIYDIHEEALVRFSEQYNVPYTTDLTKAIQDVDAVVIATPTSTHFDYFCACAEVVKNIFIEKPLASNVEDAQKIKGIAQEKAINVQVGFIERFNPAVSELKPIVEQEKVVNADFVRTNRLSSRISDVDVVLDLMIHDIDLALYLNGPVSSVSACGTKENGLVAFASATFKHENGAFSRVLASRMTEKKMRQIQITTDSSFIDSELLRKEIIINKQSKVTQDEGKPYTISSLEQQLEVKPQEALLVELQSFVRLCQGEEINVPDVDAGLDALVISEEILRQIEL